MFEKLRSGFMRIVERGKKSTEHKESIENTKKEVKPDIPTDIGSTKYKVIDYLRNNFNYQDIVDIPNVTDIFREYKDGEIVFITETNMPLMITDYIEGFYIQNKQHLIQFGLFENILKNNENLANIYNRLFGVHHLVIDFNLNMHGCTPITVDGNSFNIVEYTDISQPLLKDIKNKSPKFSISLVDNKSKIHELIDESKYIIFESYSCMRNFTTDFIKQKYVADKLNNCFIAQTSPVGVINLDKGTGEVSNSYVCQVLYGLIALPNKR